VKHIAIVIAAGFAFAATLAAAHDGQQPSCLVLSPKRTAGTTAIAAVVVGRRLAYMRHRSKTGSPADRL
jgi:hypothetical protein